MPLDTPQKNRGKSVKNVLPFENTFLELITTLKICVIEGKCAPFDFEFKDWLEWQRITSIPTLLVFF